MDSGTLIGFITFATVAGFTPGPNNVMLTASGANFGFRRSIPHIAGITIGFCLLVLAAGFGLAGLFTAVPGLYNVMKVVSVTFLLYLAWKIATAGRVESAKRGKPLTLWQAAAFQLVNPKAVAVVVSSVSAYTTDDAGLIGQVILLFIVFFTVTIGSTSTWCLFGTAIGKLFLREKSLRVFNIVMASLLVASLFPILSL